MNQKNLFQNVDQQIAFGVNGRLKSAAEVVVEVNVPKHGSLSLTMDLKEIAVVKTRLQNLATRINARVCFCIYQSDMKNLFYNFSQFS